jgi:hypothetical protein
MERAKWRRTNIANIDRTANIDSLLDRQNFEVPGYHPIQNQASAEPS